MYKLILFTFSMMVLTLIIQYNLLGNRFNSLQHVKPIYRKRIQFKNIIKSKLIAFFCINVGLFSA